MVSLIEIAVKGLEQAIYIRIKRTTREWWRVLVNEGRLGHLFLITQGTDISNGKLEEMTKKKIIVYVSRQIKK